MNLLVAQSYTSSFSQQNVILSMINLKYFKKFFKLSIPHTHTHTHTCTYIHTYIITKYEWYILFIFGDLNKSAPASSFKRISVGLTVLVPLQNSYFWHCFLEDLFPRSPIWTDLVSHLNTIGAWFYIYVY